ncbi:MAG: hypothetical protein L0Z62_20925 [Gemmataceae bacterium]|nr:hypothetical protein [Gemmataceae bacterium]
MRRYRVPLVSALFVWAVLVAAGGCGSATPKTYPVEGKVVYKGKGNVSQLAGGTVRLQAMSDPSLTAVGEIADDGSFALGTFLQDKGLPGVPAGQYKARIDPPEDDDEGKPQRGLVHPKYQDFGKSGLSITVPVSGELVIQVERPGR